jgi:hypothetical protein
MIDAAGRKIDFSSFDKSEASVMAILRDAYERGPKSAPFDAGEHWFRVKALLVSYLVKRDIEEREVPAADRRDRFTRIAQASRQARDLVNKAMKYDVGNALFLAFMETIEATKTDVIDEGSDPYYMRREFRKVMDSLATLESAALRATKYARTRRGRPTLLPQWFIEALAGEYLSATATKPGAGDGRFAKFVMEIMAALGYSGEELKYESVIDAIKVARTRARAHLKAGHLRWDLSAFNAA